jgi:MFS transporter, ACS family, hexuronate transporter
MKVSGLRWVIASLMFAETLLAYLDLQELSVLAPVLEKQIGMTTSQYAFVTQGFLVAYTVTFILGGRVIDRLGVRWGLGLSLFAWSTANGLHALSNTPHELAAFRFLLGIVYPGAFLAGARAVAEWYPAEERAFVYGIFVSGAMVGSIVAYPMVVWMTTQWNWRAPFLLTGSVGIVLGAVWLLVYRQPEYHPWITDRERQHVRKGKPLDTQQSGSRWTSLLKTRTFWAVAVGRFISDSTWMFYVLWLPKFLTDAQGLSIREVGRVGWIPFLFADVGSIGGGWLSGYLIRRGIAVRQARIALLTIAAVVRTFTFILVIRHSTPILIVLVSVFVLCTTAWQVNLSVMLVDTFPPGMVATASGLTTGCGTFSTVFFTGAVGWTVRHYSYGPVFVLLSALSLTAYLVVLLILGGARRKESGTLAFEVRPGEPASD